MSKASVEKTENFAGEINNAFTILNQNMNLGTFTLISNANFSGGLKQLEKVLQLQNQLIEGLQEEIKKLKTDS